jgi:hypothetical protein
MDRSLMGLEGERPRTRLGNYQKCSDGRIWLSDFLPTAIFETIFWGRKYGFGSAA